MNNPTEEQISCHESALRLLGQRFHSRSELQRKLRARKFPAELVRHELDELERLQLLNDAEFTRIFTAEKMSGTGAKGISRVRGELMRRGVDREQVQELLEQVSVEDETEAALQALRRRWQRLCDKEPDLHSARLKAMRFLAGRGFSAEAARAALDILEAEA